MQTLESYYTADLVTSFTVMCCSLPNSQIYLRWKMLCASGHAAFEKNILHPYNEYTPIGENPSCLQATLASVVSQKSSHTVPHWLMLHISTRPSRGLCPLWSLISPYAHITEMKNTDSYNYKTSIEFIQFYNMFIFFLRNWLYKRG